MILHNHDDLFNKRFHRRGYTVLWNDLLELFNHPPLYVKNRIPFILAAEFNSSSSCLPHVNSKGELLLDYQGQPTPGRYTENIVSVHGLILEYRNALSLPLVQAQLKGFRHFGCSTPLLDETKKNLSFWVLIPFADPCPIDEYLTRRKTIETLFSDSDPVSTNPIRTLHLFTKNDPSTSTDELPKPETWGSDGTILDWRNLESGNTNPLSERKPFYSCKGDGYRIRGTFDMVQYFKDEKMYTRHVHGIQHEVQCPNSDEHVHVKFRSTETYVWQPENYLEFEELLNYPIFHCTNRSCKKYDNTRIIHEEFAEIYEIDIKRNCRFDSLPSADWAISYRMREALPNSEKELADALADALAIEECIDREYFPKNYTKEQHEQLLLNENFDRQKTARNRLIAKHGKSNERATSNDNKLPDSFTY
jgi:hypothetical protein